MEEDNKRRGEKEEEEEGDRGAVLHSSVLPSAIGLWARRFRLEAPF